MKASINQTELAGALGVVSRGVAKNSTLPVLVGVHIIADQDTVTLQSTNLELSIRYSLPALVEEPGEAVLPGKLFTDIVKSLPDAAVHLSVEDMTALVTCENASFSVKGLDPYDFPAFPSVDTDASARIPFEVFARMAKQVCPAASRDESRAILTGVLISLEGGLLRLVATDSYRLALAEQELSGSSGNFSAVVPSSFILDVSSMDKTGEDVVLALSEQQIVVSYQGTVFVNRRIEGRYPHYQQLIPASWKTRATIDVQSLASALKRTALLGQSGSSVRFSIDVDSQTVQLSAISQDIGSAQEVVPARIEGQSVEIAFNSNYVVSGLSSVSGGEVDFEVQSSLKPGIFKDAAREHFLYLVMPVRLA